MFTTPFFLFNLIYICWPLCWVHLFNCSLLQILYLIGHSHGSSSKPLDIQTWPGRPGEVHPEPQNEEESDFESSTLVRPSLGFTEDGVKKKTKCWNHERQFSWQKCLSSWRPHQAQQLPAENRNGGYSSHRVTKTGRQEIRTMLLVPMSLDFCSKIHNKRGKKKIHLASYQWVKVVV